MGEFVGLIFTQPEPSGVFVSIVRDVRRVGGEVYHRGPRL